MQIAKTGTAEPVKNGQFRKRRVTSVTHLGVLKSATKRVMHKYEHIYLRDR